MGFEPTASLVLSQGGLPVAYRAMKCPKQESNLQSLGLKPSRFASLRIRARVVPDGIEPPFLGCGPSVVAAGPRDYPCGGGSRGTRTHNGLTRACFQDRALIRSDDFRLQVAGAGIEPTSGRSEGPVLPVRRPRISCAFWTIAKCERFGKKELNPHPLLQRQVAYHLADPRKNESALRESNPPFQLGRLAPLPLGQGHIHSCGGRNRTRDGAINSRLPVPARDPPQ